MTGRTPNPPAVAGADVTDAAPPSSAGTPPDDRESLAREARAIHSLPPGLSIELEPLLHNAKNTITRGIWRVRHGDRSSVVKVVTFAPGGDPEWQPSEDPAAWNYHRREAEFYRSDLVDSYAFAGVRAPRPYGLVQRDAQTTAIWMEDVQGRPGAEIDLESVRELSRRLGLAQGSWTRRAPTLPPWASRRFLRDYTASKQIGWECLYDDAAWEQPLIRRCFPRELRDGARELHRNREWLLTHMEELPRTLAHLDVWPNNLIFADDGSMVLCDWAFVGDGALGEDIGNLVPDAVFDRFIPAAAMPSFAAVALGGYLEGVEASGWDGDPRLVELGFRASAIKYDWLTPLLLSRAGQVQIDYGGASRVDPDERYRSRGEALLQLVEWSRQARELAESLPLRR